MPQLEISDEVKSSGQPGTRYITLPGWLCDQIGIDRGTKYAMTMDRDSDDTITIVFEVPVKGGAIERSSE